MITGRLQKLFSCHCNQQRLLNDTCKAISTAEKLLNGIILALTEEMKRNMQVLKVK